MCFSVPVQSVSISWLKSAPSRYRSELLKLASLRDKSDEVYLSFTLASGVAKQSAVPNNDTLLCTNDFADFIRVSQTCESQRTCATAKHADVGSICVSLCV